MNIRLKLAAPAFHVVKAIFFQDWNGGILLLAVGITIDDECFDLSLTCKSKPVKLHLSYDENRFFRHLYFFGCSLIVRSSRGIRKWKQR